MRSIAIEDVFRAEAGRALATLIRLVGDFEYAEDALQDAFAAALAQWPAEGIPHNARAWLVEVGRRKAIDRIRRQTSWQHKQRELQAEAMIEAQAADEAGRAGRRRRHAAPDLHVLPSRAEHGGAGGADLARRLRTCHR